MSLKPSPINFATTGLSLHLQTRQLDHMAEIELNVLSNQCLDRRIDDKDFLTSVIAAWEDERNDCAVSPNWHFSTQDARIKLKRLYPSFDA